MTKKENVKFYYNNFSKDYDKFYYNIQKEKFLQFRSQIPNSSCIFDLGGGSGILSEWFGSTFFNFDISIQMLHSGLQTRGFHAIASDLEYLPIRESSIDFIISLSALQNTSDLEKSLNEISRVSHIFSFIILSFLKKSSSLKPLLHLLEKTLNFKIDLIPFSGEDYIFKLQN